MERPDKENEMGGGQKDWKVAKEIDQKGTDNNPKRDVGYEPPDPRFTDIRYTESKRLFAEYSRGRLTADELAENLRKLETGEIDTDMFEQDPFTKEE